MTGARLARGDPRHTLRVSPAMLWLRTASLALLVIPCPGVPLLAAEAASAQQYAPLEINRFPSLTDYALRHGLAVEGITFAPGGDERVRTGDEVVYLLELRQPDERSRQWLVRIVSGRIDPRDGKPMPADTIFTTTGLELLYHHTPATLDIEFIGPFLGEKPHAGTGVETRRGRATVSAESLQAGLAGYCESSLGVAARLQAAGIKHPVYYGLGHRPKAEVVESGRKAAAAFGLTAEEERLAFSVYFALRAFYQAASGIPACREVLEQVIQKPSLWSVATHLGLATSFNYGWQHVRPLPPEPFGLSSPVYELPVKLALNGTPALRASLSVATTRPPLRNCAGIVALDVEHPTDGRKRVCLRLLAARPATN